MIIIDDFNHFVAVNEQGHVEVRMNTDDMVAALMAYERDGTLYRGVWEFRVGNYDMMRVDVRLAPQFEFYGRDTNWRTWRYSFYPER